MNVIVFLATTIGFYALYALGINNTRYDGLDNEWINLSMIATAFVLSGLCLITYKQKPIKRSVV